jgi:hypothetical protein
LDAWNDLEETTEYAAYGIAILLIMEITAFTVIRRSRKGTGFDYWLGKKDDLLFQDAARLEVSGMLKAEASAITARVKQKVQQTVPTDGTLPAYIVVVEFSNPVAHMVQK